MLNLSFLIYLLWLQVVFSPHRYGFEQANTSDSAKKTTQKLAHEMSHRDRNKTSGFFDFFSIILQKSFCFDDFKEHRLGLSVACSFTLCINVLWKFY